MLYWNVFSGTHSYRVQTIECRAIDEIYLVFATLLSQLSSINSGVTCADIRKNRRDAVNDGENPLHSARSFCDVREGHLCIGYAKSSKGNGEEDLHINISTAFGNGWIRRGLGPSR